MGLGGSVADLLDEADLRHASLRPPAVLTHRCRARAGRLKRSRARPRSGPGVREYSCRMPDAICRRSVLAAMKPSWLTASKLYASGT